MMRNALIIDATVDGYTREQCGETMTVEELIDYLKQYSDNTPVYLRYDDGYSYGSITENSFSDWIFRRK